jgi:hypothetical protein
MRLIPMVCMVSIVLAVIVAYMVSGPGDGLRFAVIFATPAVLILFARQFVD